MDSRKSFFITTVKCSNLPWPLITPNISLCREKRAISNFLRIYCYFPVIRLVNFVQVAQSAGKQIRLCCGDFLYYNKKTYVTISVRVCLYHFRLHLKKFQAYSDKPIHFVITVTKETAVVLAFRTESYTQNNTFHFTSPKFQMFPRCLPYYNVICVLSLAPRSLKWLMVAATHLAHIVQWDIQAGIGGHGLCIPDIVFASERVVCHKHQYRWHDLL